MRAGRQHSLEKEKTELDDSDPKMEFMDSSLKPEEMLKLKMESDFKDLLGQLNSSVGAYDKIRLYDVEINFNDPR